MDSLPGLSVCPWYLKGDSYFGFYVTSLHPYLYTRITTWRLGSFVRVLVSLVHLTMHGGTSSCEYDIVNDRASMISTSTLAM